MDNRQKKVIVIISHYANPQVLSACLKSFSRVTYPDYKVIIVKNGRNSSYNSCKGKEDINVPIKVIELKENLGYAHANNIGIRSAIKEKCDYVLLLNDDTIVSPLFLRNLVEAGNKEGCAGFLGPKIYQYDEPDRIWSLGALYDNDTCMLSFPNAGEKDNHTNQKPFESDYISGCALLAKRKAIEDIGLMDEDFFLYWEDVDWGIRARNAGYKNIIVPSSFIWHKVSISSGGESSVIKAYHRTRSHFIIAGKYSTDAIKRLYFSYLKDIAWLISKSRNEKRFKKAMAYAMALKDYHQGKTDAGPKWLWT